jgi:hypothetical protein
MGSLLVAFCDRHIGGVYPRGGSTYVRHETPRVHYASRQRGRCVAIRGARAAVKPNARGTRQTFCPAYTQGVLVLPREASP